MRLPTGRSLLLALLATAPALRAQAEDPFPPAAASERGVDPAALERLDSLVRGFLERDEIVGAELLVIQGRSTLLHRAYGWRDVAEERPMELDTLFCVRSMTKPVNGTAVQLLMEEGKLAREDRLVDLWPDFASPTTGAITVEHLLTHSSGFPLSLILGRDLKSLSGIEQVALLGRDAPLDFTTGERFGYSDQNSDTLAALVQRLSGEPVGDYVREHVLEPLGMHDTRTFLAPDEPLRARIASSYAGAKGAWVRFWKPSDPPLFPFFLGSQALYSTPKDYALFLEAWKQKGRTRSGRLLPMRAVRKALEPARRAQGVVAGFEGLETWYGEQWEVWVPKAGEGEAKPAAFGHSGSDGTWAWVFPEQDAMVLYFTQSRGNLTGMDLEPELERTFLGARYDPAPEAPASGPYLGLYYDERNARYGAILERDGRMWAEFPGRALLELRYAGEETWKFKLEPTSGIAFEHAEDGAVTAALLRAGEEVVRFPRLAIASDLPSAASLVERLERAHGLARLAQLGSLHLSGRIDIPNLDRHGQVELWMAPPRRFRLEMKVGDTTSVTVVDGASVTTVDSTQGEQELEGRRRLQVLLSSFWNRFGDWSGLGLETRVLYEKRFGEEPVYVLRLGPPEDLGCTRYVSVESGRLLGEDNVAAVPGMGELGVKQRFEAWREEQGLVLPMRIVSDYATPLIGTATLELDSFEVGRELPADAFVPPGSAPK